MKKYIKPSIEIVVLKSNSALLQASPALGGNYNGGTVLSPGYEGESFD